MYSAQRRTAQETIERRERLEEELATIRRQLQGALGEGPHGSYVALMSSFLGAKLSRDEFEGLLMGLLTQPTQGRAPSALVAMHNRHVALYLEKIALMEQALLGDRQEAPDEHGRRGGGAGEEAAEGATLRLRSIPISASDVQLFREAVARPAGGAPCRSEADAGSDGAGHGGGGEDEAARGERIAAALDEQIGALEKRLDRPILAAFSAALPDAGEVRAILAAYLAAYGLDAQTIEEEHLEAICMGLQVHLSTTIRNAIISVAEPPAGPGDGAGGGQRTIVIDCAALALSAKTQPYGGGGRDDAPLF